MHATFLLQGVKAEGEGRVLVGDNIRGRVVLLQPVRF